MNAPNASGWKPGTPVEGHNAMSGPNTATGNRALMLEEPLIFEIGHAETTGVDFPTPLPGGEGGTAGGAVRRARPREASIGLSRGLLPHWIHDLKSTYCFCAHRSRNKCLNPSYHTYRHQAEVATGM